MSTIITESQNFILSADTAPDPFRAEVGLYYGRSGQNQNSFIKFNQDKISSIEYLRNEVSDIFLKPKMVFSVSIEGSKNAFQDQNEWRSYCFSNIKVGSSFIDHVFQFEKKENDYKIHKNYHHSSYEDYTKTFSTKNLINYNLISHANKSSNFIKYSDFKTREDGPDYEITKSYDLKAVIDEYSSKMRNLEISIEEHARKQNNIFLLSDTRIFDANMFPYHNEIKTPRDITESDFFTSIQESGKLKKIMQLIKNDVYMNTVAFNIDNRSVEIPIHDLSSMIFSQDMNRFEEQEDEIFLIPNSENRQENISNRFIEQVRNIQFLANTRNFLKKEMRGLKDLIFETKECTTFFIGYKIKKYLSNNLIQTFYTTDTSFIDTQLKYGSNYSYEIISLVGIVGSSYSYGNLFVSSESGDMISANGSVSTESKSSLINSDYRASFEITIQPTLNIAEISSGFVDSVFREDTPPVPEIHFYNQKNRKYIEALLRPSLPQENAVQSIFAQDYDSSEDYNDDPQPEFPEFPKEPIGFSYFTGIYEVYRVDSAPVSVSDFENKLVKTIDMSDKIIVQGRDTSQQLNPANYPIIGEKMVNILSGHFEDKVTPNKKYYYAFRSLSYHGTPSYFSPVYEVELIEDSNEYKLSVQEYNPTQNTIEKFINPIKRLIKLEPNLENLMFTFPENEGAKIDNWALGEKQFLKRGQTRTIKIRVTSKHTGKKIDLNINLKIREDDSIHL